MKDPIYSVGFTQVYIESENAESVRHNLYGPGQGFGMYAGTLFSHMTFADDAAAKAAAACANEAYRQGYAAAQRDVRRVLGLC